MKRDTEWGEKGWTEHVTAKTKCEKDEEKQGKWEQEFNVQFE